MERSIDFRGVTDYDFSTNGNSMEICLFQGDKVTKIHINSGGVVPAVLLQKEPSTSKKIKTSTVPTTQKISSRVTHRKQSPVEAIVKEVIGSKRRGRPPGHGAARLNESQVREIRTNWNKTVEACGTKNAAADQLAKVYNCSPKNIYAIIYRYSWAHLD